MNDDLAQLRLTVSRGMALLLWAQLPLIAVAAWLTGHSAWPPCLAGVALAAAASLQYVWMPAAAVSRVTMAVALVGMVSLILAACAGSPMQPDIHMYYFAMLAMLAAYCDRTVIWAASATIVSHHLVLNFLAPALVFPGGGNLPRVLLHGAIVGLEATALIWMTGQVVIPFKAAARHLAAVAEATKAAQVAQEAAAASELARLRAERQREEEAMRLAHASAQAQVVSRLGQALAQLAKGDLLQAIDERFAPEYEILREDFNAATAQLLQSMKQLVDCSGNIRQRARDIAGAVADLSWRQAMQRQSLLQGSQALTALTEAGGITSELMVRAQAVIREAEGHIRGLLTGALTETAEKGMARVEQRGVQLRGLLMQSAAAAQERLDRLHEATSAMQEVQEVMRDYAESIGIANQSSRLLVTEAEELVDTICEFNISEAAARAAWKPAAE